MKRTVHAWWAVGIFSMGVNVGALFGFWQWHLVATTVVSAAIALVLTNLFPPESP